MRDAKAKRGEFVNIVLTVNGLNPGISFSSFYIKVTSNHYVVVLNVI